jgi:hypothetical protein
MHSAAATIKDRRTDWVDMPGRVTCADEGEIERCHAVGSALRVEWASSCERFGITGFEGFPKRAETVFGSTIVSVCPAACNIENAVGCR